MSIKQLISELSKREVVPIDIQDEIVPLVLELCQQQNLHIYFWAKNLDTDVLKGKIAHWDFPDADGIQNNVIDIDYPANLSKDWQRMVCAKELVHVLDPVDTRVMTEEAFEKLCERLVLPPEFHEPIDGKQVWADRLAVYQAVALLFPWATRALLLRPYISKEINIEEIASLVDIPVRYAKLVMDELWEHLHKYLSE
jgi:hypothetical protein